MNRVSDKHRKELKEYSKIRYDYFMLNHFCEICGEAATDIHQKLGVSQYNYCLTVVNLFSA